MLDTITRFKLNRSFLRRQFFVFTLSVYYPLCNFNFNLELLFISPLLVQMIVYSFLLLTQGPKLKAHFFLFLINFESSWKSCWVCHHQRILLYQQSVSKYSQKDTIAKNREGVLSERDWEHQSQKFYNNVFLIVGLKTLGTFTEF